MSDAALAAAVGAARTHGVPVREPCVIDERSNVIVRLAPEGPVARVAGLTSQARSAAEWFAREVEVARVLHLAGAPVVAPFEPAGPFTHDGHAVSFWALAEGALESDGAAAGRALAICHAVLRDASPIDLPPLAGLLTEADAISQRCGLSAADERLVRGALERSAAAIARAALSEQPLHGDAGLGNVLAGPRWTDWEDACRGPVAWDLACLVATARATGLHTGRAEAALAAHGGPLPEAFVVARAAQTAAWSAFTLAEAGRDAGRLALRLAWLRERA